MERREFITTAALGSLAFSFQAIPDYLKSNKMGVVVHSYASRWNSKAESKNYPGFQNAIELIEHCAKIGAGGAQVGVNGWTNNFASKVRQRKEELDLYLEGSIVLPKSKDDITMFEQEVIASKEAGADVLRTVCLNGRRYETFNSLAEFDKFKQNSVASLQLAEPIVRKHKVKLAVENHKDWRANELAALIKQAGSEWIGVTLDFGNSIALLENSMDVAKTLAPLAFSTHVKDMAVAEYEKGFLLSEVPLGQGIVNLKAIVNQCLQHNPKIKFSLEMITRDPLEIPCLTDDYWKVFADVPAIDLVRTLNMVKENKLTSLPSIAQLSPDQRLEAEENNIVECLKYSSEKLNLK